MNTIIGTNIARLRKAAGLKQVNCAYLSRMSRGQWNDLERGRTSHPSIWTCVKISEALGCGLDDLVRADN